MMDDGWSMMDDQWWMINDGWSMMDDQWWMINDGSLLHLFNFVLNLFFACCWMLVWPDRVSAFRRTTSVYTDSFRDPIDYEAYSKGQVKQTDTKTNNRFTPLTNISTVESSHINISIKQMKRNKLKTQIVVFNSMSNQTMSNRGARSEQYNHVSMEVHLCLDLCICLCLLLFWYLVSTFEGWSF
jgi:hypothetical protein